MSGSLAWLRPIMLAVCEGRIDENVAGRWLDGRLGDDERERVDAIIAESERERPPPNTVYVSHPGYDQNDPRNFWRMEADAENSRPKW